MAAVVSDYHFQFLARYQCMSVGIPGGIGGIPGGIGGIPYMLVEILGGKVSIPGGIGGIISGTIVVEIPGGEVRSQDEVRSTGRIQEKIDGVPAIVRI